MAIEPYYIAFAHTPESHPEISDRGYFVIEAVSIWDAADTADKLFAGAYHLIFGGAAWDLRFGVAYPDGEQGRVTTGAAMVAQLEATPAPELPEISNR